MSAPLPTNPWTAAPGSSPTVADAPSRPAVPPQDRGSETPDWAFLTADPSLGRVARADGARSRVSRNVPSAAEDGAGSWSDLREWRQGQPPFDTIVVRNPDAASVALAVAALAPGGTIRLERVSRMRRRMLDAQLESAGLVVRAWWLRPDARNPWVMVGLDRPKAAATVLRGVAGRNRRGGPEALFARTGLARRLAGAVAVTAARPSTTAIAASSAEMPADALLTPRFQSSRAVLGITMDRSGDRILSVTKTARSEQEQGTIVAEADALERFRQLSPDPLAAPRSHRLEERRGRLVLLEAGAGGRPLDRRAVRRDPVAALVAACAWLANVPVAGSSSPAEDGRGEQLLDPAVAAVAALAASGGPRGDARLTALARTESLLAELRHRRLPVVFEHGDLSHPNIFCRPDGGLTVVDWERALPSGMPLHDLSLFVAYVVESVARPNTDDELVEALREACADEGWARPVIDDHLASVGVDRELATLLELAAWTRYLARSATRLAEVRTRVPHRSEVLWLESLRRAEEATR